jgi:hypothetical protein
VAKKLAWLAAAVVAAGLVISLVMIGSDPDDRRSESSDQRDSAGRQRPVLIGDAHEREHRHQADRDSGSGHEERERQRQADHDSGSRYENRESRRQADHDSGSGREKREHSRTAYRGQSDEEAHRTARTQFPELIGPWETRWPALGKDELKHYLSDTAAVVETADGSNAVVESIVPLRGRQPDGERAPVDLALTEVGDALAPKSSATKVRMPRDLSRTLRFPDSSLGVALAGAREDTAATLTYGKAFYPNALEDTDLVLQATALGAEVSLVLRSPASPTNPALEFDLAPGQRLRLVSKGGLDTTGEAEIVSGDEQVATIGRPLAVDAEGEPVEVGYEVRGSKLVLAVDTSGPVAYPVAVDPVIYEKNEYGQPLPPGQGASWSGWGIRTNTPVGSCAPQSPRAFWACPLGDATIWVKAYAQQYQPGDYAAWINYARAGAYIFRYDTQALSHSKDPNVTSTAFTGVCNAACNAWMPGSWGAPNYGPDGQEAAWSTSSTEWAQTRYLCVIGPAPPNGACTANYPANNPGALGDAAEFGLIFWGGGTPNGQPYATINGAAVYKSDNSPPKVASVSHSTALSTNWIENYSDTASVTAVDNGTTGLGPNQPGMGMGSVTVAGGGFSQTRSTCGLSNNYSGCDTTWPAPGIAYTAPEGRTTYTASAKDIIENQSVSQDNRTWETKVDRSPPSALNPSGALYQPAGKWFREGSHPLTLQPTDAYSGVRSSEIQMKPGPSGVDGFTRTTTGGWGTADIGGAWSIIGDATRFSVDGSRGRIAAPQNTPFYALLASNAARDVDVKAEISFPDLPGPGAHTGWLVLRRQSDGRQYRVGLVRDGVTQGLSLRGEPAGALFAETDTGLVHEAGARYNVRARIAGDGSPDHKTRVRVRVWKAGTPEPTSWTVDAFDEESAGPQAAGVVGLAADSSTAGLATFGFDDLMAVDLEAFRTVSTRDEGCGDQGCNTSLTHQFDWQTSGYPEGAYEFRAIAKDPLAYGGGTASQHTLTGSPWRVDLDRTLPKLTDKRGALATEDGAIRRGANELTVAAGDSPSGVRRIEAFVSDADQSGSPRTSIGSKSCTDSEDSCPTLTGEFQWDASQSAWNRVRVAVEITDRADNVISKDWVVTIRLDNDAPQIDASLALWDRRNQEADHRDQGVYDQQSPLRVVATDGGDPAHRSGVKSIEILMKRDAAELPEEDFVRKDYVEYLCPLGQCNDTETRDWIFDADSVGDGDYVIRVVTKDLAGNQGVKDWQVTVDRRGDIYRGKEYTANPASGGQLIGDEWNRLSTMLGRRVEADLITTRDSILCTPGDPAEGQCAELRSRTRYSETSPAEGEAWTLHLGSSADDPRIPSGTKLAGFVANFQASPPTSTGNLVSILDVWQVAPPDHGDTFNMYETTFSVDTSQATDGPDGEVTTPAQQTLRSRVWVDAKTLMPLKEETAAVSSGTVVARSFWTYDVDRLETSEVASDLFSVPKPTSLVLDKEVTLRGALPVGAQTDVETNSTFTPYYLGTVAVLPNQRGYCLDTSSLMRMVETPVDTLSDPARTAFQGPIQTVDVSYSALDTGSTCVAGTQPTEERVGALEVSSTARNSTAARAWRDAYVSTANEVELDPTDDEHLRAGVRPVLVETEATTAYVIVIDPTRTSALIEKGNTTILVTGPFDKTDVPTVAAALQPR